jgi:hypothetical protein
MAVAAQQWWCEQPDREPDGAQACCAFADHVVGLLYRQVAFEVFADDHRAVQDVMAVAIASAVCRVFMVVRLLRVVGTAGG